MHGETAAISQFSREPHPRSSAQPVNFESKAGLLRRKPVRYLRLTQSAPFLITLAFPQLIAFEFFLIPLPQN